MSDLSKILPGLEKPALDAIQGVIDDEVAKAAAASIKTEGKIASFMRAHALKLAPVVALAEWALGRMHFPF